MSIITGRFYTEQRVERILLSLTLNGGQRNLGVYSGIIPTSADGFSAAAHSANHLVTFTNIDISGEAVTSPSAGYRLYLGTILINATASGTGIATWVALYNSVTNHYAIIGEPSMTGDNGMCHLSTLNIVATETITLQDLNITFFNNV